MLVASYSPYSLQFIKPVLTSRGSMAFKNGYLIQLNDENKCGVGECSFIEGLSVDDLQNYEATLTDVCQNIQHFKNYKAQLLEKFPSILFGIETALLHLQSEQENILFQSDYTLQKRGIAINGLIWMGSAAFMQSQIEGKLAQGFRCIKLKVGALDFDTELKLIEGIRKQFNKETIELRLDANGAFDSSDVYEKLTALAAFDIHSIEQPVKPGQYDLMQQVCASGIMDIALDEELIGVANAKNRKLMLGKIAPQYIILKPSFLGGFASCDEWINIAKELNIGWWATSALESNIGLNAIAQWVAAKSTHMPQGLGTGSLYLNNIGTAGVIKNGELWFDPQ